MKNYIQHGIEKELNSLYEDWFQITYVCQKKV